MVVFTSWLLRLPDRATQNPYRVIWRRVFFLFEKETTHLISAMQSGRSVLFSGVRREVFPEEKRNGTRFAYNRTDQGISLGRHRLPLGRLFFIHFILPLGKGSISWVCSLWVIG